MFEEIKHIDREKVARDTKNMAAKIINAKGATSFGIGGVTASICKSILFDQRNIRPISHYQEDLKVCLSKTVVLGRRGVVRTVKMPLNEEEEDALKNSAKELRAIIDDAEKNSH